MITAQGIIHVHSLYSYDGQESLKDIKHLCKNRGYNFVIMTEHTQELEKDKLKLFISECKSLSEDDFLIIPGLEFVCQDGLEILGLHISESLDTSNIERLIEEIQRRGGLAILAHPNKYKSNLKNYYPFLKNLNGVEIWNRVWDGKHAPRISNINLLRSLRRLNREIFAYGGIDFHSKTHYAPLNHYVTVDRMEPAQIILSLKEGRFYLGNNRIKLNSKAEIRLYEYVWFSFWNLVHNAKDILVRISNEITKHTNINPPQFLRKVMDKIL